MAGPDRRLALSDATTAYFKESGVGAGISVRVGTGGVDLAADVGVGARTGVVGIAVGSSDAGSSVGVKVALIVGTDVLTRVEAVLVTTLVG